MKPVYLDHAGATPVRPEVLEAMWPFFAERFGNPSAVYDLGAEIKEVIEAQRSKVAGLIGAADDEIIFTSSGAEANNLAIKGGGAGQSEKRPTPDCLRHRTPFGAQCRPLSGKIP